MLYVLKNDEKYYYLPEDILNEVIDKRLKDINVMQFKATKEHWERKEAVQFHRDWKKAFITLEKQHLFGIGFNPLVQIYTIENIDTYLDLYNKKTKWKWFRWKSRDENYKGFWSKGKIRNYEIKQFFEYLFITIVFLVGVYIYL